MDRITRHVELRAEGRRLSGTVLTYGDVSPSHRERFEPGSVNVPGPVVLNLRHRPREAVAWHPGGGLSLDVGDQGIIMTAELPPIPAADEALAEVRAGRLSGLSVEFFAEAERRESGLRVIERARLVGVGLVTSPSYEGSRVEARAGVARGRIPYNVPLPCDCHRGTCSTVNIREIDIADIVGGGKRDVLAVAGDYKRALGSVKRGSLVLTAAAAGMELTLSSEALETPAGREIVEQAEAVPIYARPIFDQDQSEVTERDGVAVYERMALKAVLFGPTDNAGDGENAWPEVNFTGQPRQHDREAGIIKSHGNATVGRFPAWL